MNLEDHLGDITRKARAMSGVSAEAAAKAAGLTVAELEALEESGAAARKPNFTALAGLIGLHGGKLEGIANGWVPSEKDPSATTSRRWARYVKPFPRCASIPVPKARQWTSATGRTISFTWAVCA